VLIYFIHHIPESIHISNIVAGVGQDLNRCIGDQFPAQLGAPSEVESERDVEANLPASFYETAKKIRADGNGYVQFIDTDGLMQIACAHDLVLRLRFRSDDFVTQGSVLLLASPDSRFDDTVVSELASTFVWGAQRTMTQSLRFLINQLVEVAMRALSPGVNDPFTAMNCMDWLQAALENLAERELPDAHRYDSEQNLRVVAEPETFASFASLVFDQLRPYAAADRNAAVHMMEMLGKIAAEVSSPAYRRLLVHHAGALRRECKKVLSDQRGLVLISDRYRSIIWLLRNPAYRAHVMETGDWIGGRA
jgi:uncharacterized membrane protein